MASSSSVPPKPEDSGKWDIAQAQLELLAQLVAPSGSKLYPDGGILIESIKDSKAADLGTKMLYLERALTEDCKAFNESLDKLYNCDLIGDAKEMNIDLLRYFKKLNDICFNNEVKRDVEVPTYIPTVNPTTGAVEDKSGTALVGYPPQPALITFFGKLGSSINPSSFQTATREMVAATIKVLKEQDEKKEYVPQMEARHKQETLIVANSGWRGKKLLDLPTSQQIHSISLLFAPKPPSLWSTIPHTVEGLKSRLVSSSLNSSFNTLTNSIRLVKMASEDLSTKECLSLIINDPELRACFLHCPNLFFINVPALIDSFANLSSTNAALVINTPELRIRWLSDPDPVVIRGNIFILALTLRDPGTLTLILNSPELRAPLLIGTEEEVRQDLIEIAVTCPAAAILIFGMPEFRAALLRGDSETVRENLNLIAERHPDSAEVRALCVQYMPSLPPQP